MYSFVWVISWRLNFICRRFGRKNQGDEIVGVFIREKVWLDNSLSQPEGQRTGMGRVQVEKQTVEGQDPKWRPVVSMVRRNVTLSE
jgi:hypothetical protein